MGLQIKTNVQSLVAQHRLHENREQLESTQNRLASGSRIIKAMDDAAGLAISESMRSTLRSTAQNMKNSQDAFYMLQTAESSLEEITNIVIRMKELATQSASDTYGDKERSYLDSEYQQLKLEIDRLAKSTTFNGRPLMGEDSVDLAIQVGPRNDENVDRIKISTGYNISAMSLGVGDFSVATVEAARNSLEPTDSALNVISTVRGAIGAGESRINTTLRNLMHYQENISGANSQIRDADIAHETAEFAKANILSQSTVSVLSQANSLPSIALKLIGN